VVRESRIVMLRIRACKIKKLARTSILNALLILAFKCDDQTVPRHVYTSVCHIGASCAGPTCLQPDVYDVHQARLHLRVENAFQCEQRIN